MTTTTTTCLDPNACPNDKMYNVICNFSIGINEYACNRKTTCMRADGTYDCCSNHIVRCIVDASTLRVPTIQPSMLIQATACNRGSKIDKCYWYENMRTNNLYVENNKEYCCFQNRAECCSTNQTYTYIVFGSIAGIIVILACYWYYYVKNSYHKIIPVKEVPIKIVNEV
jgi:hypothetical protein